MKLPQTTDDDDPWLMGWRAYRTDVPFEACPFLAGSKRVEWCNGWENCDSPE